MHPISSNGNPSGSHSSFLGGTVSNQYEIKRTKRTKHTAHCADRRRRSGAQTSATEVERSRTGRRSVRAQWRTPPEGEVRG